MTPFWIALAVIVVSLAVAMVVLDRRARRRRQPTGRSLWRNVREHRRDVNGSTPWNPPDGSWSHRSRPDRRH